jgi:inner membrane protein
MASAFSYAVAALSIGTCFYLPQTPKRVWIAGALCSIVPDIDVIGFRFGNGDITPIDRAIRAQKLG